MKNLLSNDTKISFLRIFSGLNLNSTGLYDHFTLLSFSVQGQECFQGLLEPLYNSLDTPSDARRLMWFSVM